MNAKTLLLVLGAASGCAAYPQKEGEKLAAQVYALQTQLNATQKTLTDVEASAKIHAEQIAELTKKWISRLS